MRKLKIGFDIHGVIDDKSDVFSALSKILVDSGNEVHVITGSFRTDELEREIKEKHNISYTHFFSILDYHKELGTKIEYDEDGQAWIEGELWDKTKAEYCQRVGIDLHLDDSDSYGDYFLTPYARFYTKDRCRVDLLK